jgi:hypothetical protein
VRTRGLPERALAELQAAGHTYEEDGALWFRSTTFGDDKDRVLRKSDGELTYFAVDIAFHHYDKFGRADRVINFLAPTTTAISSACGRPWKPSATPGALRRARRAARDAPAGRPARAHVQAPR